MEIYSLKCSRCNGILNYDKDNPILFCPYCGEKLLIIESDAVKLQTIKSNSKKDLQHLLQMHEINMEVLQHEIDKDNNREQSKDTVIALLAGIGLCIGVAISCWIMVNIFA